MEKFDGYPVYAAKAQPRDDVKYDTKVHATVTKGQKDDKDDKDVKNIQFVDRYADSGIRGPQRDQNLFDDSDMGRRKIVNQQTLEKQMLCTVRSLLKVPQWYSDFLHYKSVIKIIVCKRNKMTQIQVAELDHIWSTITTMINMDKIFLIAEVAADDSAGNIDTDACLVRSVPFNVAKTTKLSQLLQTDDAKLNPEVEIGALPNLAHFLAANICMSEENPFLVDGVIVLCNTQLSSGALGLFQKWITSLKPATSCTSNSSRDDASKIDDASKPNDAAMTGDTAKSKCVYVHMFTLQPTVIDTSSRREFEKSYLYRLYDLIQTGNDTGVKLGSYYCCFSRDTSEEGGKGRRIEMVNDRVLYHGVTNISSATPFLPFRQSFISGANVQLASSSHANDTTQQDLFECLCSSVAFRVEEIKYKLNSKPTKQNAAIRMYARLLQDVHYSLASYELNKFHFHADSEICMKVANLFLATPLTSQGASYLLSGPPGAPLCDYMTRFSEFKLPELPQVPQTQAHGMTSLVYNARHLDAKAKTEYVIFYSPSHRSSASEISQASLSSLSETTQQPSSSRISQLPASQLLPAYTNDVMSIVGGSYKSPTVDQLCNIASQFKTDPMVLDPVGAFCLYLRMHFQLCVCSHAIALDFRRYCQILLDARIDISSLGTAPSSHDLVNGDASLMSLREYIMDDTKPFGQLRTMTKAPISSYIRRALIDLGYNPDNTKANVIWYLMIVTLNDQALTKNQSRVLIPNETDLIVSITTRAEALDFVLLKDKENSNIPFVHSRFCL